MMHRALRFTFIWLLLFRITGGTLDGRDPVEQTAAPDDRPNILLILTDDQGWPTLGCYGGQIVPTPHLDRLAAQGVRFTDAYVTSQCTPTRATLLTGQYTARSGLWHVLGWYGYPHARMTEPLFAEGLSRETFTLARGLQRAGYATGIMGKWHLTTNADGNYMGLQPQAAPHYGFDFAPPPLARDEFDAGRDRGVTTLTDQAINFIERNQARPWFCFLSHHMIHGRVVAPEEITQRYREQGYGNEGPNRAVYLAGLECIDRSVGRLMKRLEQLGETDETLVLFLSDNGGIDERLDFKGLEPPYPAQPTFRPDMKEYDNAPLRAGKGSIYEGGVRVPFIARWPNHFRAGSVVETPVHVVDILPTCLDVARAGPPRHHQLDGHSLVRLLGNGSDPNLATRPIFQYCPFYDLRWGLTPSASVRLGDYKLVEFFGDRVDENNRYARRHRIELYDLRKDLGETRNLAEEEPARARKFRQQLHAWLQNVGAPIPVVNTHYDPSAAFLETREKPEWLKVEFPDFEVHTIDRIGSQLGQDGIGRYRSRRRLGLDRRSGRPNRWRSLVVGVPGCGSLGATQAGQRGIPTSVVPRMMLMATGGSTFWQEASYCSTLANRVPKCFLLRMWGRSTHTTQSSRTLMAMARWMQSRTRTARVFFGTTFPRIRRNVGNHTRLPPRISTRCTAESLRVRWATSTATRTPTWLQHKDGTRTSTAGDNVGRPI